MSEIKESLSKLFAEQDADDERRDRYAAELAELEQKIANAGPVVPGSAKDRKMTEYRARVSELKDKIAGIDSNSAFRGTRIGRILEKRRQLEGVLRSLEDTISPGGTLMLKLEKAEAEAKVKIDKILAEIEEYKTQRIPYMRQKLEEFVRDTE